MSLEEKDAKYTKMLEEKREELTNCQSNFKHAGEQIMILQEQLEEKDTLRQKLEKDLHSLQETLEQAQNSNASRSDEFEKAKIELDNSNALVSQLEQELNSLRETSAQTQLTMEDELKKLQQDVERKLSVEQEFKSLQESCEQHKLILSTKEEELDGVKGQLKQKDVEIEEMQQTILSLQNSLKEDCSAKDDEIRRLKEEADTSREELAALQKSTTEYRMELETSKLEHETLKGQAAEVSRDKELLIQQLKNDITSLEKKLSSSEEQIQSELH